MSMHKVSRQLLGKAVLLATLATPGLATPQGEFRYDADNADTAAHWAARSTLASVVMFGGLGEPLQLSMSEMDAILAHAGYVMRPPMPDMPLVGAVYAAGDPRFPQTPNFSDPATLRWDEESFDRTLDPGAQAWALVKITSPGFHLTWHDRRADRRAALLMLPQAEAQARTLAERLRNQDGMFAPRATDGAFGPTGTADQAAVLWGASNLVLAATSEAADYWHQAYRDLVDVDDYRPLADAAFGAVKNLPPDQARARAIAIEALGRYALAAESAETRREALDLARTHADELAKSAPMALEDIGLAIYGLVEAGRLLDDVAYANVAVRLFRDRLLPRWSEADGVFADEDESSAVSYTPERVGALVAALDALRWHGSEQVASEAAEIYPRFLEAVLIHGRLLQSSPKPLVPAEYLEKAPVVHFADPALPAPIEAGVAPVFAKEVRLADGEWTVTDRTFRTGPALFLANMLVGQRQGEADAFLPEHLLERIR